MPLKETIYLQNVTLHKIQEKVYQISKNLQERGDRKVLKSKMEIEVGERKKKR
jgi:hypothetical protein